ncbi:MAG TPA: PA14 domain-containing protein [Chitinophagaceae bacterium]|nr:PA14 domain-containing protein [Chitinophagaceae bacterium]
MKNSRRRFLGNASLTVSGMVLLAPSVKGLHKQPLLNSIGCAPPSSQTLTGSVASVQSGKWSDPATWGGKLPAVQDTVLLSPGHRIVFDSSSTTVNGINISAAAVLAFDEAASALLQSTANIVVEGKLEMHPSSAAVVHTMRFTGIQESNFVGGGMDVLTSDIGLWVMGSGQLDLAGTAKTPFTNATGSIGAGSTAINVQDATGWLAGDEISIAPTESPAVGDTYFTNFEERTVKSSSGNVVTINAGTSRPHPMVNNQWTAEVINLTRNVRIEGTAAGRAHIFIRSSAVQKIKYAAIQYMGPRKDRGGTSVTELVAGRYGLHFHHCDDASRGSVVEGSIVRNTNNHSYVPHVSHGITFLGNIAYNVLETAFWWDPGDPTHDIVYDHNLVANCKFLPASLNMNAEDAPTFASSGFALNSGDDNICKNNIVVAGGQGDAASGGAYNWEAVINEGVWQFSDNIAHNCSCGLRVWQNSTRAHIVENYTAYHNGLAIFHGAYANSYKYNGGYLYANGIQIKAASANSNRVRFENITIDGAGFIDYGVEVIHSPLPGERPVLLRNLVIRNCKVAAVLDSAAPEIHSTDIVQCTIDGAVLLHPEAAAGETIRIQPAAAQATQITKSGSSTIGSFAASLWGDGKGLNGAYFNGANFSNPAFSRIDPNISFTEWSAGVHHAITSNTYSVRWTGKIQPQFSEDYIFYLSSGGGHRLWIDNKLILDKWEEHYPDSFQSAPIRLVAGQRYDIKLEYFNQDADTGMGLFWKSASLPLEYVPQSQLYASPASPTPSTNQKPVANAGADITLTLPANKAQLNGSASADTDGNIVKWEWSWQSGPSNYTIADAKASVTDVTGLVEGAYVFLLKVTDDKGNIAQDTVTVTVNSATNLAPVANAGKDITASLPANSIVLDGTASSDKDGSLASCLWTLQSGPSGASIQSPTALTTPVTNLQEGVYVFRLSVTDNKGASSQDDVTITINGQANMAPVANAGSDVVLNLPVNSTFLNGAASTDPDGTLVSCLWAWQSGPSQYNINDPKILTPTVNNMVAGTYVFRLTVTDNKGASSQDDVRVLVKDIPSAATTLLSVVASPNPTTVYFTLSISGNNKIPVQVSVYNVKGVQVYNTTVAGGNTNLRLGLSWPTGVYYAVIQQGNVRRMVSLVKR